MVLDELQRRNYSANTVRTYIHAIEDFALGWTPRLRQPNKTLYAVRCK